MTNTYTYIIPMHNEESRISNVLDVITNTRKVPEIICIDDGSSDNSSEVVEKNFPQVKLIKLAKNQGKAAAILTGLEEATGNIIILIDADLKDIKSEELNNAIELFAENNLNCLILSTAPRSFIDKMTRKLFRILICAAGDRIIKKDDLLASLSVENLVGYQMEFAQNKYLLENNKKVAYTDISAINPNKLEKSGVVKGLICEFTMWKEIISYTGIKSLIRQTISFAKTKLK